MRFGAPWFLTAALALGLAACAYWHGDYGLAKAINAANEIGPDDAVLVMRVLVPASLLPVYLGSADGAWKWALRPGVAADRPAATEWEAKTDRLNQQGYVFVMAKPGNYVLRLSRPDNAVIRLDQPDAWSRRVFAGMSETDRRSLPGGAVEVDTRLQAFAVPANKLLYRGTLNVRGFSPPQRNAAGATVGALAERVREEDTLKVFAAEFPDVYAVYENRIAR